MSLYNQTAWLRRVTGATDDYGQPTFGPQTMINVRWESQAPARVPGDGMSGISDKTLGSSCFTEAEADIGDEVTFSGKVYHVFGVTAVPTLDGVYLSRELVVK